MVVDSTEFEIPENNVIPAFSGFGYYQFLKFRHQVFTPDSEKAKSPFYYFLN
jgi:hypothetical protein